ncbi:MAG: translation initiation factor [Ardenticatenaceae bacterium]
MPSKKRIVYSTDPTFNPKAQRKTTHKEVAANQQTIYVERSRKGRKGKTVTIISKLQHPPATLKKMLKQFKGLCGAGGSLKDGNLEIQGDHRDKLIAKLKEMGYKVKPKGG